MLRRTWNVGLMVVVAGAIVCGAASAQDAVQSAQNKLLARRAAEADCFRKLAETVYGVKITSETFVRDFVTESDEIRAALDMYVKGIKLGKPRYYEDGTCEVDAEVTVAKLVTELKRIHTEHYRGRTVHTSDFEHIKESIQKEVIRVTGMGAPREELPPELPAGVEDIITPLPPGYTPQRLSVPPIWRAAGPQAKLMALRAARLDAMRQLLERIKGLRLTSDTLVRDFITEYDEIATRAQGIVIGASEVRRYLHNDELIAEVTMEVPVEKVVERIRELHTEYYRGRSVTTTDIVNIKRTIKRNVIEATGSGVPPARYVSKATAAGYDMPSWIGAEISATGEGTTENPGTAQGKLMAIRAAEVAALRKLAEQVYGLQVSSNMSVRGFVTQYDEITTQVDAAIRGAVFSNPVYSDGVARVTASIRAADVWRVVHQHMLIVSHRG